MKVKIVGLPGDPEVNLPDDILTRVKELQWYSEGFRIVMDAMVQDEWSTARRIMRFMLRTMNADTASDRKALAKSLVDDHVLETITELWARQDKGRTDDEREGN